MSLKGITIGTQNYDAVKSYIKYPGSGRPKMVVEKAKGRAAGSQADKAPAPEVTHYLLRGGRWSVPAEFNDEFLWHYAISIQQGYDPSVVERRTSYFRFHMDLDFNEQAAVTLEQVRRYFRVIVKAIRKYFPLSENDFFECVICNASPKEVVNKDASVPVTVKSGYHLVWPWIWVTSDQALSIRANILSCLTAEFGARKPPLQNLWQDVVDESIYIANGLRMIGAAKWSSCTCRNMKDRKSKAPFDKVTFAPQRTTKKEASKTDATAHSSVAINESDSSCDKCQNKGFIYEGRPYWAVAFWSADTEDVTRLVTVPTTNIVTTATVAAAPANAATVPPLYKSPHNLYKNDPQSVEKPNTFRAMPCPSWSPVTDQEDAVTPLDAGEEVSIDQLILLGDVTKTPLITSPSEAWKWVRRLHNTLRLTCLRISPELQSFITAQLELIASGVEEAEEELSKRVPIFKKFRLAPPSASSEDVLARITQERSGKSRYDARGQRVELLNEFKDSQKANLVYVTDEDVIEAVQNFIRVNAGTRIEEPYHPYEQVMVSNVVYTAQKSGKIPGKFFVHVTGIGSAFCQNKDGDHNRHSIYFEIGPPDSKLKTDKKCLYQRCFCRCNNLEGRQSGLCKDFRKYECEVPIEIRRRLFSQSDSPLQVQASQTPTPVQTFDAAKTINTFASHIDLDKFERYKQQKRDREIALGLENPEERLKKVVHIDDETSRFGRQDSRDSILDYTVYGPDDSIDYYKK